LSTHTKAYTQQDLAMDMEQNLRVSLDLIGDNLRAAAGGVPRTDLSTWVYWVSGFDANPQISTSPAGLSVAACTSRPVVTLTASAVPGDVTLWVASDIAGKALTELLDTNQRGLISIDDAENAHVTAMSGGMINVDTNPTLLGDQGLTRGYPAGTTICRVDVTTFEVIFNETDGRRQLYLDANQGGGPQPFADSITDLLVTPIVAGEQYEVSLTASSIRPNPLTGLVLQRTLNSTIRLRNAG
jgi:hypothetical protein